MKMALIAKHIKHELIKETIKTLSDEKKLVEIIKNDEYLIEIRALATKQITDEDLLMEIIFDTSNTQYAKDGMDIREIAVKQIRNEQYLYDIVQKYYDETSDTKYGLNVVKKATEEIIDEDLLLDISKNNYDEEIINLAVEGINNSYDEKVFDSIAECDNDIKVKRMHALDKIDDDEALLDVAMNGKYMDVRQRAIDKIKTQDEMVLLLKSLIIKEMEYQEAINEYLASDDEEKKDDIINKASNLEVEYKKAGNSKKEKFYNEQCSIFKNN